MGGSLPWENKPMMEMPAVEILINNARERAARNENLDDPENEENEEFQVVYEHCAYIRFMYSNGALNISKTTDAILRLLDTVIDFTSAISEFFQEAKDFEAEHPNSISTYHRIYTGTGTGIGTSELEEQSQSMSNAKLLEGSKTLIDKFNHRILPRFMQIHSMCNYHIGSIKRLVEMSSEGGEIEPGTISPLTWEFYIKAISILQTRIKTIGLNMRSL